LNPSNREWCGYDDGQDPEDSMSSSIFTDSAAEPTADQVAEALGDTRELWAEFQEHLEREHGPLATEWKMYSKKWGWVRKTLQKKRNLFFFTPLDGCFRLGFIFGDKAVAAIEASELPESMKDELRSARKYAEGRGLTIEVRSPDDLESVKTLVEIKLAK
jgi:hypothetical protein